MFRQVMVVITIVIVMYAVVPSYAQEVDDYKVMKAEDYKLLLDQSSYNVGYSPNYSPLTYLNENGELVGISVEILNGMVEDTGITLNWIDITQLETEELSSIDISLMAPNYSGGYFEKRQSNPYFYYPYVVVKNYDYDGKSNTLGILNFYEIEESILDIVANKGEILSYLNFVAMEEAFFNNEIGSMIVTNMVYNKMRSEVKAADYLVTPINAKLDITLAFGEGISFEKIEVFNKLIAKLDSIEMEYLFSEHVTYTTPTEETLADVIRNYWELLGASFLIGSMTILIGFLWWQRRQTKSLQEETVTDRAIISCAEILMQHKEVEESIYELLSILSIYFKSDRAIILYKEGEKLVKRGEYIAHEGLEPSVVTGQDISFAEVLRWYDAMNLNKIMRVKNAVQEIPIQEKESKEFTLLKEGDSFVATPLFREEEIIGFLWVENPKVRRKEENLLLTVSAFIDNYLMQNQLNEDLASMSYHDSLTGLYNRNYYMSCIDRANIQEYKELGIIFADVNGLKKANDQLGHEYGDLLLKWSAAFLQMHTEGIVFRIGGDEFVCFMNGISQAKFVECVNKLFNKIETYGDVHISLGCIWEEEVEDIAKQVGVADQLMYENKQGYYKQKESDSRSVEQQLEEFRLSINHLKQELHMIEH
ncbi:MAG: GGDEF domain-containing protein [Eubacteriales bacterium]